MVFLYNVVNDIYVYIVITTFIKDNVDRERRYILRCSGAENLQSILFNGTPWEKGRKRPTVLQVLVLH